MPRGERAGSSGRRRGSEDGRGVLTGGVNLLGDSGDILHLGVDGRDLRDEKAGNDCGGKDGVSRVHLFSMSVCVFRALATVGSSPLVSVETVQDVLCLAFLVASRRSSHFQGCLDDSRHFLI